MSRDGSLADALALVLARHPRVDMAILFGSLAESLGRPVDLIDLGTVGEPLLGQVLRHGRRLLGSDERYAGLLSRHLFEMADFAPYRSRILAERRQAWIGR